MLVVYIHNDKVRYFITCDSDMMSLHALRSSPLGAGKRVLQLSRAEPSGRRRAFMCFGGVALEGAQKGGGGSEWNK